jgi:uncharacterized protein YdbL (DUF1318 family)
MKMRKKLWGSMILAPGLLAILACVTINIYFPEATVKKVAEDIVEEVRRPAEKEKNNKAATVSMESFSFVPAAYAQQETEVSTPAIRAIKESLKDRFPRLEPYFERGSLGESNAGFVEIRDESGLSLKEKGELRNLVKDENADRGNLYAEVARALNIEASQIPRIQKIFASSWIKNSRPGWWIQQEDGEWIKKT